MKKLMIMLMVVTMTLMVGCKLELETKDVTEPTSAWDVLQPDGSLLITNFDMPDYTSFLQRTAEVKDYHIVIQSGGGNAANCLGMMNRISELQSLGAHITTEVHGIALSGGALIFIMGDTRIIHENAILMFHAAGVASYSERLNAKKLNKKADPMYLPLGDFLRMLDEKFQARLLELGLSEREVDGWLYHEDANFMGWEEALELNIANDLG